MTRNPNRGFRPSLAPLEPRRPMAAGVTTSLANGVLTVMGTPAGDTIVVGIVAPAPGLPGGVVGVWGLPQTYAATQVRSINIFGGAGNDAIAVKTIGNPTIPVAIYGGGGDDYINGVWDVPPPNPDGLSAAEQRIVDLTNAARQQAGLAPLTVSPMLVRAAQIESGLMAQSNTMSHEWPGTALATDPQRVASVGYRYYLLGENLGFNYPTADMAVAGWLASPPHRANIMTPGFTQIGVSIAYSATGNPYYTVEFGLPS